MEYWMDRPRLNGGETVSMYLEPFTALIVDNGDGRMEPDDIPRIGKTIYVQDYKKGTIYAEYLQEYYHVQVCPHNDKIFGGNETYETGSLCFPRRYLQPLSVLSGPKSQLAKQLLRKDI